eukprot:12902538-Prorocentrum_lima.AAC.1
MPRKTIPQTGWVLKWKKSKKEVQGQQSWVQSWVRIVKARPAARGFKDMQAYTENIKTYSRTATKWAQRVVN